GRADTGESAPAASVRAGLFRRLLAPGRADDPACAPGAADETLGGREGRPHRWRMRRAAMMPLDSSSRRLERTVEDTLVKWPRAVNSGRQYRMRCLTSLRTKLPTRLPRLRRKRSSPASTK